jgi:hypothetical protein
MPAPRSNCAVVPWEDRIYILGGNDEKGATATCWEFDPIRDSWRSIPSMPEPRYAHDAFVYRGSLIVLGGMSERQGRTDFPRTIEAYDLKSGKWSRIGEMPTGLARAGVTIWKDRVVCAGGIDEYHKAVATVRVFDPGTETWGFLPPLPEARNRLCLSSMGGTLVAVGGEDSSGEALSSTLIFSEKEQRWEPGPSLAVKRKNFALMPLGPMLVATGGWDEKEGKKRFIAVTELYDSIRKTWDNLSPLIAARDGVRGCIWRGKAYVFGGYNGSLLSSTEEGAWQNPGAGWGLNEGLRVHLAFFDENESRLSAIDSVTSAPLGFSAPQEPDISNIVLKNILSLDFPLPRKEKPEHLKFYLKFYQFPAHLDQRISVRRVLESFLIDETSRGGMLMDFTREKKHVIVKKGIIDSEDRKSDQAPFPPLSIPRLSFKDAGAMISPQDYFDRQIPFASIYVIPRGGKGDRDPALASSRGVLAFHRELLDLYGRVLTEVNGPPGSRCFVDETPIHYGLQTPLRLSLYRIPTEPLVFKNYRDLPMPQDPSRMFLTGLLLLYREDIEIASYRGESLTVSLLREKGKVLSSQVFEVGSVVTLAGKAQETK